MSTEHDIETRIAESGDSYSPAAGWQQGVWRSLQEPTQRKSRRRTWVLSLASVAVLMLVPMSVFRTQQSNTAKMVAQADKQKIELQLLLDEAHAEVEALQQEIEYSLAREQHVALKQGEEERLQRTLVQIRFQLEAALARLEDLRIRNVRKKSRQQQRKRREKARIAKCSNSNDPLCGL